MPLQYIGKVPGFSQRTYSHVFQTKFYPETLLGKWRSPVTQASIRNDLYEFNNSTKKPDSPMLRLAIARTFEAFRLPQSVKMVHLNDVFSYPDLDIWSKSPGLPWRDCGYKTKGDIKKDPEAIRKVRHFWHRVKAGEDLRPPDCLAYVRSHVCDVGEKKVRAVWGYPATVTFAEAMFALPLIKAYKDKGTPLAYGYETATGGMKKLCNRYALYKTFVGLDFSKFDKTVPTWLIHIAFDILMYNIDFINYDGHGIADARRSMRVWDYLKDYFINTTIRTANGCRYRKNSGIASGSYFTQLIGSVCNYILCLWMSLEQNGDLPLDIIVQGDDSLMAVDKTMSLNVCDELMKTIGMHINTEKSQVTYELQTMKFLGYRIGNGCPNKDQRKTICLSRF